MSEEERILFTSYAHLDEEKRKLIADALSKDKDGNEITHFRITYDWDLSKGQEEWSKQSGIKTWEDWRSALKEFIEKASGNVIALLSKNSMKEKGVCRDELAVAINHHHGQVFPILLSPEAEIPNIPPCITHKQWLDLSNWDEITCKDGNKTIFTEKGEEELEKIKKALSDSEFFSFNDDINHLKIHLKPDYNIDKWSNLLDSDKPYHEREWLTEYVDKWAQNRNSARMLVLTANPGFGKSMWAAHFAHHNVNEKYRVALGAFVQRESEKNSDVKTIVKTIAFSVACAFADYRKDLRRIIDANPRCLNEYSSLDLFKTLISEPLASCPMDGGRENVIIFIDGVDEAAKNESSANELAELLKHVVPTLPEWTKVLVTTRNISPVTFPLGTACSGDGSKNDKICEFYDLSKDENRFADVRAFAKSELSAKYVSEPGFEGAIDKLVESSQGDFLAVALIVNALNSDKNSKGLGALDELTPGLEGHIESWFKWIFYTGSDDQSPTYSNPPDRLAVELLLKAPDELPREELCVVMKEHANWEEHEVNVFLDKVKVITRTGVNVFGDETVSFNHDFVKSWLKETRTNFYASKNKARESMATAYWKLANEKRLERLTPYELIHILELLIAAKMDDEYDDLSENAEYIKLVVQLLCFGIYGRKGKEHVHLRKAFRAEQSANFYKEHWSESESILEAANLDEELLDEFKRLRSRRCSYIIKNPDEVIQDEGNRYAIVVKGEKPLLCVGCNPSDGDETEADNYLNCVERIIQNNGYDGWIMVNLYSQRTRKPDKLHDEIDEEVSGKNLGIVKELIETYNITEVWAAWGDLIEKRIYLRDCLSKITAMTGERKWVYFGELDEKGHPKLPSKIDADAEKHTLDIKEYLQRLA